DYQVHKAAITKMTKEVLSEFGLGTKEAERCKNMFVLGMVYWLFDRDPAHSIDNLNRRSKGKDKIIEANTRALMAGYHFGETSEIFPSRFHIEAAEYEKGIYRSINGN